MIDITREIVSIRVMKAGYEIRTELWHHHSTEEPTPMKQAYSPKGDYIGSTKLAKKLVKEFGITSFEPYNSESRVVCHGYSPTSKKWYGWSHRAIHGFGIGDMLFEESFGDDSTPYAKHGSKPIVTLEDAKQSAFAFAEHVS